VSLPIFQTSSKDLSLLQTNWAQQLNPIIEKPTNQSNILKSVSLTTGTNVINHLLGRTLQGWKIVRQRALATIYDNQDNNQSPQITLFLVSSANVSIDLEVF
jgi:hypothetical protein